MFSGSSGNMLHSSGSVIAPKVIQVVTAPPAASSTSAHHNQSWVSNIIQRKRPNEIHANESIQSDRSAFILFPISLHGSFLRYK